MFSLKILHQAIILYEGFGEIPCDVLMGGGGVKLDIMYGRMEHCMERLGTHWQILLVDPAFITRKWTMDSSWFCQMYSHYWTWQKSSSIFPSTEKEGEAILLGHLGISLVFPLVISLCIPSLHASKEIDSCFLLFHLLPNGIVVPVWQHNLNCSSVDTLASQNDGLR